MPPSLIIGRSIPGEPAALIRKGGRDHGQPGQESATTIQQLFQLKITLLALWLSTHWRSSFHTFRCRSYGLQGVNPRGAGGFAHGSNNHGFSSTEFLQHGGVVTSGMAIDRQQMDGQEQHEKHAAYLL